MKSSDLISIIVPIYKVEKYIEKCIKSIVDQSYQNLEIILVDDGSPDKCPDICDKWAKIDDRIKVIHKVNGGLSDARNVGFTLSTGKYIGFVDSDDYIEKNMYEKLYVALKSENADLAICNLEKVQEDGNVLSMKSPIKNETCDNVQYLSKLASPSIPGWYYVTVWNKLYRREILEEIKFPVNKIHEDEFVIHEIIYKCKKIVSIDEKLYKYVQRNGSIMSTIPKVNTLDAVEAICARIQFFEENRLDELLEDTIKRLKYIYDERRFEMTQPKGKTEKRRAREIDSMFRNTYFKYDKTMSVKSKLKYYFPSIWKNVYLRHYKKQ